MDYYSILGVPRTATQREVRSAYLRLARENHPDRFPEGTDRTEADRRFQLINESYNHLRDERLRREYDRALSRQAMAPEQEARLCYKNGQLREESGDHDEALKLYYEAMRLEPANAAYKTAAGRVMAGDRAKQRQAVELLEQAIASEPKAREAYLELGLLYSRSGLFLRAQKVYERGLKEVPGDLELRSLLSQVSVAAQRARK